MMAQNPVKNKRARSALEILALARLALENAHLITIVLEASSPSVVERMVNDSVRAPPKELKKIFQATRWLAVLKRDHELEFWDAVHAARAAA